MFQVGGKEYTEAELAVLAKAGLLQIGQKNDPASTTLTATPFQGQFHGSTTQFGTFSAPGTRPGRFSAVPRMPTVASALPFIKSDVLNERLEIMTGVSTGTGTNATGFCGNPATSGQPTVMAIVSRFGEIHIKTSLVDDTLVGLRRNRADIPGEIYNAAVVDNPLLPQVPGIEAAGDTMDQLRAEMFQLGFTIERSAGRVHYAGTQGTQNNTFIGIQTQWNGLDQLIRTGYTDADSGLLAPAADSIVTNFNADIGGTDASGQSFVVAITNMYYALKQRAAAVGMPGVTWAITMRPEQFRRATEVWACNYVTYQCSGTQFNELMRDGQAVQALRLELMRGQYLLIDGEQVPVIIDEGITITTEAQNQFRNDIYFVPLNWAGRPLTYVQYADLGNSYAQTWAEFTGADSRVINNGLYRVAKRSTGFCDEFLFAARLRLIMETPFLAARLQNVRYTFLAQTRAADPAFTGRYAAGGTTYRT